MESDFSGVVRALDRAIVVLQANESDEVWVRWLSQGRAWLANGESSASAYLLKAFGGAGSINDLTGVTAEVDHELKEALAEVYRLVREV